MPQKNRTGKGVLGGLLGLVGLSAVAGILVTATVTPAIALAGAAGSQALDLFENLPSYLEVDAPMEPSTFYATGHDGNPVKLATFFNQNRTVVAFDQVSPTLYDAILSSEDKGFYDHGGVNIGATVRALVDNLRRSSTRGASTITQQYVKNVLVQQCEQAVLPGADNYDELLQKCWLDATNAIGSDGVQRKLEELRYAIQIEKIYSKNKILLGYLNISNFGGQVYGIEAASNYYFSTTAANLTLPQAATLAGIVREPNLLRIDLPGGTWTKDGVAQNSAEDGYATTLDRRDYVLRRMFDDGKITQAQYEQALATPIEPAITPSQQGCANAGASAYFCQYVKSIVLSDPAFGETEPERREMLERKGLEIYTSLDLRLQDPVVEALQSRIPPNFDDQKLGAASVTLQPQTGRVLAMAQNTIFEETATDDQGRRGLVFAADRDHGGSGGVPVGSTYKLFTLLDWLEQGHSLNEVVNGRNRLFTKMTCDGSPVPFGSKKIGNFNDNGGWSGTPISFTAESLNSGYLAMAEMLDLCSINRVADRLGVGLAKGGKTTDQNYPFNVLGDKYIAPLDMAGAYATVANNGVYCTPRAIDRVVDQTGAELPLPESSCSPVLTAEVAATAAYALEGVMDGGTGSRARPNDGVPVFGKTGSHEEFSTMMIESSTNATTAVWVGRWEGDASIWNRYVDGLALQDARYFIARDQQRAANALYGGERFPSPDRNLTRRVLIDLPNVVGKTVDEATQTLESAGFRVTVGDPVDSDLPTNVVAAQDPPGGKVAGAAVVTLSPSNQQGVTVPDVIGDTRAAAQPKLAGFASVSWAGSCTPPAAKVSSTTPAAGTATNKNATITVECS